MFPPPQLDEAEGREGEIVSVHLVKIGLDDRRGGISTNYGVALRADFSNDRHYSVEIMYPFDAQATVMALHQMAQMIAFDPKLRE